MGKNKILTVLILSMFFYSHSAIAEEITNPSEHGNYKIADAQKVVDVEKFKQDLEQAYSEIQVNNKPLKAKVKTLSTKYHLCIDHILI